MTTRAVSNHKSNTNEAVRVAILDLGTNTFHLLIAEVREDDTPEIVHEETIDVKLGEGGISKGCISPEAFTRGINALKIFNTVIQRSHVKTIKSAATSAIRSAVNGVEFIEEVKAQTNLELEVIDGEREAGLIYQGVKAAIKIDRVSLIVDIGGGSVEFIICDNNEIFWEKSYAIGAARMMAKFHQTDPISKTEIYQLKLYLEHSLKELQEQLDVFKPKSMIGSAGVFETFAQMQNPLFKPSFKNPQVDINLEKFAKIFSLISKSTHNERTQMPNIISLRVDMIVVATVLTNHVLQLSEFESLKVSYYSLKEGLLFELLK